MSTGIEWPHGGHIHHDENCDGSCDVCGWPTPNVVFKQGAAPDALTVLRPGDRVLVVFREANLDHVKQCLDQLHERFPDVEFSALAGADQVLVQPSEESERD